MKVLLISHTCQSRTEGQPRADRLGRIAGVELRVLVPDRWKHYGSWRVAEAAVSDSFSLFTGQVSLPWAGPAQCYLHWYPGLRDILEEFRPDVIDLWEEPWGLVSVQACRLRNKVLPAARIVSETEQNINKTLPFPFEQFRRYTLRNADMAVARSSEAARVMRARGYQGPMEIVPNGVDTESFRSMDSDPCRRELVIEGFLIGYVGRIVEEKGLTDLLEALKLCHASVQLLLIGSGPADKAIRARAAEMGLTSRVHLIPSQPPDRLPRLINAMHCLVLPSRTTRRWKEQFGRVLVEAGACGVPVIGSDSGAIPEVVGDAGLIVPERNPTELAAAIERLRSDPALRRRLGAIGRRRAESFYAWERVAERLHSVYTRMISSAELREGASGLLARVGGNTIEHDG